jgi:hypothetical protein
VPNATVFRRIRTGLLLDQYTVAWVPCVLAVT